MPEPRDYQTEAIIIKKTKLAEADRILTFYTPRFGKLQAVAKGVRRPKSKMAGHLELLTYSQVSLARGRNLDTVTGTQTIDGFLAIKNDLWLTSCALYVVELVNQFGAERMENYPLFRLLLETLKQLAQAPNKELLLRYFELHLLDEAGYRPQLRECVSCRKQMTPVINYFHMSGGGMLCPDCAPRHPFSYPVSVNAQKVLRLMQDSDYATASRLKLDVELSGELKTLLENYLKYLLEREIKSVRWLDSLREQIAAQGNPPALPRSSDSL
ncbi:MAG: DNA repair protein RecO [Dehalococcoidales bacterium]|nr:DNA repair protein RecO [Dehalococcoidales bacterium]